MPHKIETKVELTIDLSFNEVCRLRALFQNPIGCDIKNELPGDQATRLKMFEALDDCYKALNV